MVQESSTLSPASPVTNMTSGKPAAASTWGKKAHTIHMPYDRRLEIHTAAGVQPRHTTPIQKLMPIGAVVLRKNFTESMTSVKVVCNTIESNTTVRLAKRPTQT